MVGCGLCSVYPVFCQPQTVWNIVILSPIILMRKLRDRGQTSLMVTATQSDRTRIPAQGCLTSTSIQASFLSSGWFEFPETLSPEEALLCGCLPSQKGSLRVLPSWVLLTIKITSLIFIVKAFLVTGQEVKMTNRSPGHDRLKHRDNHTSKSRDG